MLANLQLNSANPEDVRVLQTIAKVLGEAVPAEFTASNTAGPVSSTPSAAGKKSNKKDTAAAPAAVPAAPAAAPAAASADDGHSGDDLLGAAPAAPVEVKVDTSEAALKDLVAKYNKAHGLVQFKAKLKEAGVEKILELKGDALKSFVAARLAELPAA